MSQISINDFMPAENYIIETFKDCNIIGLGEGGHGLKNSHHFFHTLFDNKTIQEILDVVIIEFANTDYQAILDQYIFGETVDLDDLRKTWRESTQPGRQGEVPIYFELLKKVRSINKKLPQHKKIRVLGGDPSINWKKINDFKDYKKQMGYSRDKFPAELAINFGIKQAKKVLIIYSEVHLTKIPNIILDPNYQSITSIINKKHPAAIKTIGTIYSESLLAEDYFNHCQLYSIINLDKNELGKIPAYKIFSKSLYKSSKEISVFEGQKIEDLFDALLFVGQYNSLKRYPMPKDDFDNVYWNELNRRRKIVGMRIILKPNNLT